MPDFKTYCWLRASLVTCSDSDSLSSIEAASGPNRAYKRGEAAGLGREPSASYARLGLGRTAVDSFHFTSSASASDRRVRPKVSSAVC